MIEKVTDIEEVVKAILSRNQKLSDRNLALELEIADLRVRLTLYEQPEKDSHNSSIPSSRESLKAQGIRRTRSLRTPSDKPTGGQLGHTGSTVLMSQTPIKLYSMPLSIALNVVILYLLYREKSLRHAKA